MNDIAELRARLDELARRFGRNLAPITRRDWGGADVCVRRNAPERSGDARYVVTANSRQLSWLFEKLGDYFRECKIDGFEKEEFFGRLANAAIRYQSQCGGVEVRRDLLLAVLHESFAMLDEMESGEFASLRIAVGNEIADDHIPRESARGFVNIEETMRFFAERGVILRPLNSPDCGEPMRIPEQITAFVAKIAALYPNGSTIDPCCEDISILERLDFATERTAIFRNSIAFERASAQTHGIVLDRGDINDMVLDRMYNLVVNVSPDGRRVAADSRPRRLDLAVAERCLDLIAPDGVCLMLAPTNFLTAPIFQSFRSRVLGMALDAVIEFPRWEIDRRRWLSLALLVIRKGAARECGTLLGDYRTQGPELLIASLRDGIGNFFVSSEHLSTRWDRNYHDPCHHQVETRLDAMRTNRIEELGEVRRGHHEILRCRTEQGAFLILNPLHLRAGNITASERNSFVDRIDEPWFDECIVQPGDVVVSLTRPVAYVYKATDPPAVIGPNIAVIRSTGNDRVAASVNSPEGKALFQAQVNRRVQGMPCALSIDDLREIRIPI